MRIRTRSPLLVIAATTVMVGACAIGSSDPAGGGLRDTSWVVTTIAGQATVPEARPTIVFDAGGRVSGTTGCNTYSGAFATDGDRITIEQVAATVIGCVADRNAQEAAFTGALTAATHWRRGDDGGLRLSGGQDIVATPAGAATAPSVPAGSGVVARLPGTAWRLASLGGQPVADIVPTLKFDARGNASGNSGCNTYNGTYTIDGDTIAFGPMISTKMACVGAGNDVEAAYLGAIQAASTWSVDGDGRLHLEGATALVFDAA